MHSDWSEVLERQYTIKEVKILRYMKRKKGRNYKEIKRKVKVSDGDLNVYFSHIQPLIVSDKSEPGNEHFFDDSTKITLTDFGRTVLQRENDKRADIVFSRAIAFVALVVSIVALFL